MHEVIGDGHHRAHRPPGVQLHTSKASAISNARLNGVRRASCRPQKLPLMTHGSRWRFRSALWHRRRCREALHAARASSRSSNHPIPCHGPIVHAPGPMAKCWWKTPSISTLIARSLEQEGKVVGAIWLRQPADFHRPITKHPSRVIYAVTPMLHLLVCLACFRDPAVYAAALSCCFQPFVPNHSLWSRDGFSICRRQPGVRQECFDMRGSSRRACGEQDQSEWWDVLVLRWQRHQCLTKVVVIESAGPVNAISWAWPKLAERVPADVILAVRDFWVWIGCRWRGRGYHAEVTSLFRSPIGSDCKTAFVKNGAVMWHERHLHAPAIRRWRWPCWCQAWWRFVAKERVAVLSRAAKTACCGCACSSPNLCWHHVVKYASMCFVSWTLRIAKS